MKGFRKNNIQITPLEKRLMLDASLGALVSSVVFAENTVNTAEQVLDNDVSVTGTTTDFDGDTLTVSTTGGAEDQLTINDEGTGVGQIGFDGTNVTYSGGIIGTLSSNGVNGNDLSIALNANATKASIERLIENVTYQDTSDNPTLNRTLTVSLGSYFSEDISVTVVAQNDVLTLNANNTKTVNEGATTAITTTDLNITDPDDADTDIVFSVGTPTINGQLELTTNAGVAITSFTLDDIVNNRVIYVHDGSETTADSFDFTVTDGDATLASETFNITVTPVNDPLTLDTNTGTTVFENLSTVIGGDSVQFGSEFLRFGTVGQHATWDGTIDNRSHQYSLVFTTPAGTPNGVPGEVLFESGGAGVGVGLFLNSSYELDFYAGGARSIPRLSSDALMAGTQYAVVVEIDQDTDEIRMHYKQAGNFSWYAFGRSAEKTLSGYTATDHSGSNQSGVGQVGGGSYGGYVGGVSGTTTFQGSLDSDLVITEFPSTSGTPNTILVANDFDTSADNIIYTVTTDVSDGTLYRDGVALGLGDTFSQSDLDFGFVTYSNAGGGATSDAFGFSVTDGTTILSGNTFNITIDNSNIAPEILTATTIYDEDFEGGASGWNNNTTTSSEPTFTEFLGRFNRNIDVPGNQEIYQTFTLSGTQEYVTIEFDFYALDSWDNEFFYVFVDDNQLTNSHRIRWNVFENLTDGTNGNVAFKVDQTTEALGLIGFNAGIYDQTYHFSLTVQTSDPTIKLGFGSSLNATNLNDEAFGIDNILIQEVRTGAGSAQEIYAAENAANNDIIGAVQVIDPNAGQPLTYSITGGTGVGIFDIDSSTGNIRVLDNSTIDFETTTSYTLDIDVTDSALSDTQTITINILDVLENTLPDFVNAGPFTVLEDAAVNDDVDTVTTTDAEGDNVTYSIVGGNTNNTFKIDATTGLIEVRDNTFLDFDSQTFYDIRIRATDDNVLSRFRDQTIRINVQDVDEAPTLDIGTVIEIQNPGVLYSADTGNFYKNITTGRNYNDSLAFAETQLLNGAEGHLVTITSLDEYTFIRDFASASHIWIALSDAGEEGKWIWTAGPEAGTQITQGNTDAVGTFNRWLGTEPNSGDTRNHALFHANGWWYDNWPGTNAYHSTIEWEGADVLQSGNNSLYNINHSNPDASDVSNGDSVGFVRALDPEGDTISFSIQGGNTDGIFEIDAVSGEIRILDTTNLDATVNDTYTLTIRATEDTGGKFGETNITINFNDDFTISANNPLNVNEDSSAVLTTAELDIADLDGVAADTVFRVTTLPSYGQLEHSLNPGFQISTFTLDDIQNGRISFVHDGAEVTSDSFEFSVTDGGDTSTGNTFNINIVNVNDAPTVALNTGAGVTEGGRVTIDNTMLDALDLDDGAADLTYTASSLTNGHIEVSGVMQTTFTQDDIDNNRVEFVHDGSEGAAASFAFSLADGGEDGALPASGTFNLAVTAVNDSPLITTNTGASVVEGAQVTVTTAMLNTTDPDDSGAGLTYTLSGILNGQVELSTVPGAPVVSFTQADLNAGRVVFVHDGGEGDAEFTVTVADGGEDGATTDSATFNLTRIPVNDSPVIGINAGSSINQNSIVILKNSVLRASDPDDSGAGLTFTITGATNGQLEFVATPNVAITSFTQDDIDNSRVLFRHSGPPGVADFDFSITDGGEDGAIAANGTFNLTVDNTNDAPVIATNAGPIVPEGSTTTITTAMLDSFDPDDFGVDLTWTASNLSNGILQVGGVTQNTFTQADLDAGLVAFIHDGSETLSAGFDISVADGGEDGAMPATGTFTLGITPVNEGPTLIVNDGAPNVIDFNNHTIDAFDALQDGQGGAPTTSNISPDGSVLTIGGNAWKKIDIPYTLTANTVLSFEFFSDDIGEIFGIGFDDTSGFSGGVNGYQLGGTQTWSGMDQSFNTYDQGDGWVRFDIPIGADFTGVMNQLVFVLDDDTSPTGEASFRNVNFYESTAALSVNEGASFAITNAHINSVDVDDTAAGLNFTASNVTNGHIEVGGVAQNTFTQDDINNNRVEFIHDGSETLNAGFDISLIDGGEDGTMAQTGSFTLIVNPVNDSAIISTNTGGAMAEGGTLTITSAMLGEADPDDDGLNVTYTSSSLTNGHIEVGGVAQNTFTQADIDNGLVTFVHDDSETTAASFAISLADGLEDSAVADTATFNITVTPVNEAPVLTINTTPALHVSEGGNVAITTAQITGADVDDAATDLTYSISNITNGHLELTTGVGTPITSFTQDDLNNGLVIFVHDDSQTLSAGFDIALADGGEDGAATQTGSFTMVVDAVNDAPVIGTNTGANVLEGGSVTITTAMLSETDPDDSGADLTYTASSLTNGHIEVSGTAQNTFTQSDIDNGLVTFVHDGSETLSASFALSLADGLEDGAMADTATFNLTVTPSNDAPFIAFNMGGSVNEGGITTLTNTSLRGADIDNVDAGLIYTITALPLGTIENTNTVLTLNIGDTFTQGDIDNGFIQYTHHGGEDTVQSLSFTLSDGAITTASMDFTWTINPVNDTPTDLGLTSMTIEENSNIGAWIGNLYGIDADLPGDTFSFSIMSDPDNKFMIVGNQLLLNGSVDFEAATSHSITIRADDNNGGFVDRLMTIQVQDLNENPFVAPPSVGNTSSGFNGGFIEDEVRPELSGNALIQAFLSGNEFAQMKAFYGEGTMEQILRENTTSEIRNMMDAQADIEQNNTAQIIVDVAPDTAPLIEDTAPEKFTNMRHMLEMLERFEAVENEDNSETSDDDTEAGEDDISKEFQNLYTQFDDVLTYHEQRKEKLRQALMS